MLRRNSISYLSQKYAKIKKDVMHPIYKTLYKNPLVITSGNGVYINNGENKQYLDLFGGVTTTSIGHADKTVTDAIYEQLKKVTHVPALYLNPTVLDCAQRIVDKLPDSDEWCITFTNSGSESNKFAVMQARAHTNTSTIVTLQNSYHGFTDGAGSLNSVPKWRMPIPNDTNIIRTPPYYINGGDLGGNIHKHLDYLDQLIQSETNSKVAGFIGDQVQGVAGVKIMAPGYLQGVYNIVRKYNGLCIFDEVQTGFGRLGTHYWGFEVAGVKPDIIVAAKSIANGMPLSFVATKKKYTKAIDSYKYFNTFGGCPVSCAACIATMKLIDENKLQKNCLEMGTMIIEKIKKIKNADKYVKEVRGSGLLIGIEFYYSNDANKVLELLKDKHYILVGIGGQNNNVIRIHPPMTIDKHHVHKLVTAITNIMTTEL